MKSIPIGFTLEATFQGEYDLYMNRETGQKIRVYTNGDQRTSSLKTGEYERRMDVNDQ